MKISRLTVALGLSFAKQYLLVGFYSPQSESACLDRFWHTTINFIQHYPVLSYGNVDKAVVRNCLFVCFLVRKLNIHGYQSVRPLMKTCLLQKWPLKKACLPQECWFHRSNGKGKVSDFLKLQGLYYDEFPNANVFLVLLYLSNKCYMDRSKRQKKVSY